MKFYYFPLVKITMHFHPRRLSQISLLCLSALFSIQHSCKVIWLKLRQAGAFKAPRNLPCTSELIRWVDIRPLIHCNFALSRSVFGGARRSTCSAASPWHRFEVGVACAHSPMRVRPSTHTSRRIHRARVGNRDLVPAGAHGDGVQKKVTESAVIFYNNMWIR